MCQRNGEAVDEDGIPCFYAFSIPKAKDARISTTDGEHAEARPVATYRRPGFETPEDLLQMRRFVNQHPITKIDSLGSVTA